MTHSDESEESGLSEGAKVRERREARLAKALRANLRKRKSQARARRERCDEPPTRDD